MIAAGQLRHRVDIELRTGATVDKLGVWAAVHSGVPAQVRPRTSKERFAGERSVSLGTHEVTLRYVAGLTTSHRLKFGSRYLLIAGIVNMDEENRVLELDCTEGTA